MKGGLPCSRFRITKKGSTKTAMVKTRIKIFSFLLLRWVMLPTSLYLYLILTCPLFYAIRSKKIRRGR
jgi:hypothetical protein